MQPATLDPSTRPRTSRLLPISILAITTCLSIVSAGDVHAVSLSITNATSSAGSSGLSVGDTVTLDIVATTDLSDTLFGVGISISGYDPNIVEFVEGEVALRFFELARFPGPAFTGSSGRTNFAPTRSGFPSGSSSVQETSRLSLPVVELLQGVSFVPVFGDGSLDTGVDGGIVGEGDSHARVTFRLIDSGFTSLSIGTDAPGDTLVLTGGETISANGTTFDLFEGLVLPKTLPAVPEPTSALLLGLGLTALGSLRQSS